MNTLMIPSQAQVVHDRLSRSVPLRQSAWHLTKMIGHVHGAVTGADPSASAAALHGQYPALQALLSQRLATRPVATVHAVDRALTGLVVEDAQTPLDQWAERVAGALVSA